MNAVATGGESFYSVRLRLCVKGTRFPQRAGDPANARSFSFSVRYVALATSTFFCLVHTTSGVAATSVSWANE